ncbi:hypothetical protein HPP92_025517 [Vanilla planifolia]|uniref:Uncharacterized protein n=1 Tax=Vanilla planifolia TaxID=51239 RepID=A0A835UBE6_VANPL|nr:hypothetical protein HPP92_025825 [Vanilla planifolia]KAG0454213.1 hypothetical protein HPP92_025517 [Vanilla planifolia]
MERRHHLWPYCFGQRALFGNTASAKESLFGEAPQRQHAGKLLSFPLGPVLAKPGSRRRRGARDRGEMALWMDGNYEITTDREREDLDAIAALKESAAVELKEQGNKYVKMGKRHFSEAIDCYTRAINQKALSDSEQSVLFSNRAHVNLMLGNYRRAIGDAEEAIKLSPTNVKAYYRAAKALFSLDMFMEASSLCGGGLEQSPSNEDLKKLYAQIDLQKKKHEQHKDELSKAVDTAKVLSSAFEIRETCSTLPWDKENAYTREAIELYYQAHYGSVLSKRELFRFLLQGTAVSLAECGFDEDNDEDHQAEMLGSSSSIKWMKVEEKKTLSSVLRRSDYIIPAIPVFYVVSTRSSFYKEFKAGNWLQP